MRQAGQAVPDELMKFDSTIKKKEHKFLWPHGRDANEEGSVVVCCCTTTVAVGM